VKDNLELFSRMRAGEFPDGARTLRAKIDMAPQHESARPVIYRILHASHHARVTRVCLSDVRLRPRAIGQHRGHHHSLCSLEYEIHRPLYDWFWTIGDLPPASDRVARLNVSSTVVSKRKLLKLVQEGHVNGWTTAYAHALGSSPPGYTPRHPGFLRPDWVAKKDSMWTSPSWSTACARI